MKKFFILVFVIIFHLFNENIYAQSGPAGVGNSTGANSQPENVIWFDASSLSLANNAPVTAWSDISGNANNAAQATVSLQPIYKTGTINGLPSVYFDGADDYLTVLDADNLDNTIGVTVIVVGKPDTPDGNSRGIVSKRTAAGSQEAYSLFTYTSSNLYFDAGGQRINGTVAASGNAQIFSGNFNGTIANPRSKVYNAGAVSGSGNGPASIGNMTSDLHIGILNPAYGIGFKGDIAEVIIYRNSLNEAQMQIVHQYLNVKYGITITNDYYDPDAAYTYNVTGIGKESNGEHSETSSVGMYLTSLSGLDANGEYVFASHNNVANSSTDFTISDLPLGVENRYNRVWSVEKVGNLTARISFDFSEAVSDGKYPVNHTNYVLLYRSGTSGAFSKVKNAEGITNGDQVYFNLTDAEILDGYYTFGTEDETASPLQGADGRTWYTLISGDWDNWETWTLDPSGALPNNPDMLTPTTSPTNSADNVVILNGKTVTLATNNKTNADLTVTGRLDINTTTGHAFTKIKGNGRVLLQGDNFPAGDATHFVTYGQGAGTVVYQTNASLTTYDLNTTRTFYNVEVDLYDNTHSVIIKNNYIINNDLLIKKGILQINDNSSTTNLNIIVSNDITIQADGKIHTGTGNARHQLNIYGDLTNNGELKFTNRAAAVYGSEATDGIIDANFLHASQSQQIYCNGISNFYRIEIDKGTDMTYELSIVATSAANFNLFGYANEAHGSTAQLVANNNALGLIKGTVRIKNNVSIPVLSNTGNYNISEAARLWVDGGTVQKNSGNSLVPYGAIQLSSGLLEARVVSGITTRANGLIKVEGGTLNTNVIRTSVFGASNVGGYVQSGGTVNIVNPNSATNDYYHFSMTYPGNVFNMSGGTLHVYDASGTATGEGGIFIASDPENINVTGGTVIAEIASTTNPFKITSTAPFYNLILRNTLNSVTDHILDEGTNINGDATADLAAQPLVVLNDLTIEDDCFLDHNGQDITVGAGMSISANSQQQGTNNYGLLYNAALPNTLTFNGSVSDTLYIGYAPAPSDGYELYVWNLTVNKSTGSEIVLKGDPEKNPDNVTDEWHNRLINTQGTLDVQNGTFNQGRQSLRAYGPVKVSSTGILGIYEPGVTDLTAYIMLKDSDTELETEDGAQLGNFKLNPAGVNVVSLASNLHIKRIGYYVGVMNIKTFKLKLDYLHSNATTNNYTFGVDATKMIYSDANASDGGIELYIPANSSGSTFGIPLGTTADGVTRSTPAEIRIDTDTDDGYIQIRPVDGELKTTNLLGGNLLSYYWRVSYSDFTALPTVRLRFRYNAHDDDASDAANFVQGKVLDENPYTRSVPSGWVNTGNNTIGYDPITLAKANFTAGRAARFVGAPEIFYVRANGNWRTNSTWSFTRGGAAATDYPKAGDIAVIRRLSISYSGLVNITQAETCAAVIFDDENGFSSGCPRIIFNRDNAYAAYNSNFAVVEVADTHQGGVLTGESHGAVVQYEVDDSYTGTFPNGDFGDFNDYPNALVIWKHEGSNTLYLPVGATEYPQLWFDPPTNKTFVFPNTDVTVKGMTIVTYGHTLMTNSAGGSVTFKKKLRIGHSFGSGYFKFPGTGTGASSVTVEGNIILQKGNSALNISTPTTGGLLHTLTAKSDISLANNSSINLTSADTKVNLIINGESNNSLTNSGTGAVSLYRIIMNKGIDQTNSFTFNNNFILSGTTSGIGVSKALELQNGTLIFNNAAINVNLTTGNDNFYIPGTACLKIDAGTVNCTGNSGILLDGKLHVNGGIVDMRGGDNYIQYSSTGDAEIEINAGSLLVGSQIRRGTTSTEGILTYIQTGGIAEFGINAASENTRGIFEILNTGSSFTFSGGNFNLANDYRTSPTIQSFYFNPENANFDVNMVLNFGSTYTVAGEGLFTIYSSNNLPNITVNNVSTNNPELKMEVVPLTIDGNLEIQNATVFDANGLDLTIKGDFTNSGNFIHNLNTTYFSGTATQELTGETTFYRFVKNTPNTVNINSNIIVAEDFHLLSGNLADNSNEISVLGNLYNEGLHVYGGTGNGIYIVGTTVQKMESSGEWGKITINNPEGVLVETDPDEITINNAVRLVNGVFDIGRNMLVMKEDAIFEEGNIFSENNMVRTFLSFTDNGIKKYFDGTYSDIYTFPIGSESKYTPVIMDISSTGAGSIRVKASNKIHPTIQEDVETCDPNIVDQQNVLLYYWTLKADNGLSTFNADITMKYYAADAIYQAPYALTDYITAKLILGTTYWNKYDYASFEESNNLLHFNYSNADETGINGDYTAGVELACGGAIPDEIPAYISIANGNWTDESKWDTYPVSGGTVPTGGPNGAIAIVDGPHSIIMNQNYILNYKTTINGTLDVGTTFGQNIGYVDGTGELYVERGDIPAAVYDDFILENTGTFHYGGTTDYDVLSNLPIINNLKFSGTGERRLPNMDLVIRGTLVIEGTDATLIVKNEYYRKTTVKNNITFNSGSFDAGTGTSAIFEISGTNHQTISGTGSFTGTSAFNYFVMYNPSGLTLNKPIEIDQNLTFFEGIIYNDGTNYLTLNKTDENVVIGASTNNYVDGTVGKKILNSGNFIFPVGNSGRYGQVEINNVAQTTEPDYWYAEYFNDNPLNGSMNPDNFAAPLQYVSHNEYWRINGPAGASSYVKLRWDTQSGASALLSERNFMRVSEWKTTQWEHSHTNITASGTQTAGTITTETTSVPVVGNHYFTIATELITTNTWQGDVVADRNNWFDANNWIAGTVPSSTTNAIIPTSPSGGAYFPIIDGATTATTLDLTIETGASVTINAESSLTLTGSLTNYGTVYIKSPLDSLASGSFIDNGSVSGSGVFHVERYINRNKFHYVSSPIQVAGGNATSALFTRSHTSGNYNPNFYYYQEAYNLSGDVNTAPAGEFDVNNLVPAWAYAHNGEAGADIAMQPKNGYAFWSDQDLNVDFTGNVNTGDMPFGNLTYTPNDPFSGSYVNNIPNLYDGWNLVGNPYPSSINWDLIKNDIVNLDEGIYVWNGTAYSNYVNGLSSGSLNNGGLTNLIPPMQAFFVRANKENPSFSINNTHRAHGTNGYLKGNEKQQKDNLVTLKIIANGNTEITHIYFEPNATEDFDSRYDALCLYAQMNEVPNLYSIAPDNTIFAVNALPEESMKNYQLPIGLRLFTSGNYSISIENFNGFDSVRVFLEDKYTNQIVYLDNTQNYSFNHSSGDVRDRFVLHFLKNNPPVQMLNLINVNVYQDNNLNYSFPENLFVDNDSEDFVTYSVEMNDDKSLPEWLNFNPETLTFSGTPNNYQVGDYFIKIIATDTYGAINSTSFVITAINVNDAPLVNIALQDIQINAYEHLSYTIPENTFIDIDPNDKIEITAALADDSQLPAWLTFNPQNNTFSGIPNNNETGLYNIKVTATDLDGAFVSEFFSITVNDFTNIDVNQSIIEIFPNPNSGIFTITTPNDNYYIEITDVLGRKIIQTNSNSKQTILNLENYAKGTYYIKILFEDNSEIVKPLIIK